MNKQKFTDIIGIFFGFHPKNEDLDERKGFDGESFAIALSEASDEVEGQAHQEPSDPFLTLREEALQDWTNRANATTSLLHRKCQQLAEFEATTANIIANMRRDISDLEAIRSSENLAIASLQASEEEEKERVVHDADGIV